MKHTKEPWANYDTNVPRTLNRVDYERAVACVNAMAGVEDPQAFMDSRVVDVDGWKISTKGAPEAVGYRIEACVNSMKGIPDPEAFVKAANWLDQNVRELFVLVSALKDNFGSKDVLDAIEAYRTARGKE